MIIDLHMPGLSGLEVLKQAKVMEAGRRRTPFIILTADATNEAVTQCQRAGAHAFLAKPISVPQLLDTLAGLGSDSEAESKADKGVPASQIKDVVSYSVLEELAELDLGADFIDRFVEECIRDARHCIGGLESTGASASWDEFRDHCHALKGVASNMGANQLASYASEAMRAANWQLPQTWRSKVAEMRRQLELARVALKRKYDKARNERDPE